MTPERGRAHPLGATPDANGVNFSLYASHATAVELLLFDAPDAPQPSQVIPLDAADHETFGFWHVYVPGLRAGAHYAYRADGPFDPHGYGLRYDRAKVLLDPYARGTTHTLWDRAAAAAPGDNVASALRGVVIDPSAYDWEGDRPLDRPMEETVIYELHVGGFTKAPSSGCRHPGTFAAVVEKIPYLQELGVTAVELLPVFAFDETDVSRSGPDGARLSDFWGYNPLGFFSPHHAYCIAPQEASHVREFRDLVKALHRAGIEVILDVVFNHTSEGDASGPTISLRGLDNSVYYQLRSDDKALYVDDSGCGHTVNCNHPLVQKLILDSLHFWVQEMHVDGFRFDEASILTRGEEGVPLAHPPLVWAIGLSDRLAETKIIAEAWDAAGLYQVGHFPGPRWAEWNGPFRDTMRHFVRGDPGVVGLVASRLAGSADIYQPSGNRPSNSINFITCHDGFTLNDLVSYNAKHNEANGENNQDGSNDNVSWNCGVEGPTQDPQIAALRRQQIKNCAALLLLSRGVPMILAGDELGRTQQGNNNAYCQDNATSWVDWTLLETNRELFRFFQQMIAFRKRHAVLRLGDFFRGETSPTNGRGLKDIAWHGCRLYSPGWGDPSSQVLAFTLGDSADGADLHVMLNMGGTDLEFDSPPLHGRTWHRAIDTAAPSPTDIVDPGCETPMPGPTSRVPAHSIMVLVSR